MDPQQPQQFPEPQDPVQSQPQQSPQPPVGQQPVVSDFTSPVVPQESAQTPTALPQEPVTPPVQPTPTFTATTSPALSDPPAPKSKKPLLIKLLIAVVVLFILAGGSTYAYFVWRNNQPDKVLADAITNTLQDTLSREPIAAVSTVEYTSKSGDELSVKASIDAKANHDDNEVAAKVTVSGKNLSFETQATARTFGSTDYYIKVDNLSKTISQLTAKDPSYDSLATAFAPVIKKIDNKWVRITPKDLQQELISGDTQVDKCSNAVKNLRLSDADKKTLKKIFKEHQFVIVSEKLPKQAVDGDTSYHYKIDFQDQAATDFMKQAIDVPSFATVKKDCNIKANDITSASNDVGKVAAKDGATESIELWVSAKTRRPTKLQVNASDKVASLTFSTQPNFNPQNPQVEKPSSYITIEQLQSDIAAAFSQTFGY